MNLTAVLLCAMWINGTLAVQADARQNSRLDAPLANNSVTLFRTVRIFDGRESRGPLDVLIRNGRIDKVADRLDVDVQGNEDVEVIDGAGKTLLPGLIDCHTHTFTREMLEQALAFGVTTELDMFTAHQFAAAMRAEQAEGRANDRADIFSAGTLATAPGGHGTQFGVAVPTLTSAEQAGDWVAGRLEEGSDYIKIVCEDGASFGMKKATLTPDIIAAVIKAAHQHKKLAVVHIARREHAREVIERGADGLVHVWVDEPIDDAFTKLAADKRVFVIPTLTVLEGLSDEPSGKPLLEDPALGGFIAPTVAQELRAGFPQSGRLGLSFDVPREAVRKLNAAGVTILAGTDAPNPGTSHGVSVHRELELLVQAGLTPSEALTAATAAPAERFGLTDRGRIAPKLRADLLLVEGDPTADIKYTRRIVGVWKAGRRLNLDALREQVAKLKEGAANAANLPPPPGSESGLVSDFEGGNLDAAFGAGWMESTDKFRGGSSSVVFEHAAGGAKDSKGCMAIRGTLAEQSPRWAGVMFYPGTAPMAAANLSAKKEITFWAKGEGKPCSILLFFQARGFNPATRSFTPGDEWKQFRFPISSFADCSGADIMGVFIGASGDPGEFKLRIDDVRID